MTYSVKLGTEQDIQNILNNAIVLGPFQANDFSGGGKTLIFNSPAATVTFPGAANAQVSLADILAELEGVSGLHVKAYRAASGVGAQNPRVSSSYLIAIWHEAGLDVDAAGTANSYFKLSTTADTVRDAPIPSDRILAMTPSATMGAYAIILEDDEV